MAALARAFILSGETCHERGYLPFALSCAEGVGALAGIADIAVGTLQVTTEHQLVGQFPDGSLVGDA